MRRTWLAVSLGAALLPAPVRGLYAQDTTLVRARNKAAPVSSVQPGARGFGTKPKTPVAGPLGPRRALVIGISNYKNVGDLHFAAADAQAFAAFLRSPAGGSVPIVNIRLLLDSAATGMRILDGVTWLYASQPGDEAIIYFAGHGDVDEVDDGYLLAYDARVGRDYRSEGAIRIDNLLNDIRNIVKRQVMVSLITDACRAGTTVTGQVDAPQATAALMREWNGVATLASSGPNQLSQEGPRWENHGVFTYFLIRGLNGLANRDGDRFVTFAEVARFVEDSVAQATASDQVPATFGNLSGRIAAWVRDPGTPVAAAGARRPGAAAPDADAEPTDSSVLRALAAFRAALSAGALLGPDSASAWFAYRQLQDNPAAATILPEVGFALRQRLQVDAQQVITDYMEGGDRQPDARRLRGAANELGLADLLTPKTSALASELGASRLFLEGYAYLQKGDYASALPPLRASVARDPQAYAYNALGFAFLASNQLDSARQAFSIARSSSPRRAYAYPLLGLALVTLDGGEPAPALALLDSALTISQPQASLHLVRALALLELGRKAETIAAFRAAQKIDPRVIEEVYLQSLLSYSPGILARVPRLRAAVR